MWRSLVVWAGVTLLVSACEAQPGQSPAQRPAERPAAAPGAAPQQPPVSRGFVGAYTRSVEMDATGYSGQFNAARVEYVLDDSPAAKAGIRPNDIILAANGKRIESRDDYSEAVYAAGPGGALELSLLRDGKAVRLTATVAAPPANIAELYEVYAADHMRSERDAAVEAHRIGDLRRAFERDLMAIRLSAYTKAPDGLDVYYSALEDVTSLLPRLAAAPGVPTEADRHNRRALAILQSATTDEDFDRAADEFAQAIYEAPWLPEPYLNKTLALEKSGDAEGGLISLRSYLIVRPAAREDGAIKQKRAALEVLADDRKPWLKFAGPGKGSDGSAYTVALRGRALVATYSTPPPNTPYRKGDVLFRLAIHGNELQGKYLIRSNDPGVVKCYGPEFEVESRGTLDPTGKHLSISIKSTSFDINSCQETGTTWPVIQAYNRP